MAPTHAVAAASVPDPEEVPTQFLTFICDGEVYGINILRVQEIKGWTGITPIPEQPTEVLGVLNLRGEVVPIIDLRACFGLAPLQVVAATVVIVVRVGSPGGTHDQVRTIGLAVDAVSDVQSFAAASIRPAPDMGSAKPSNSLLGIAAAERGMVLLLNLDGLNAAGLPGADPG